MSDTNEHSVVNSDGSSYDASTNIQEIVTATSLASTATSKETRSSKDASSAYLIQPKVIKSPYEMSTPPSKGRPQKNPSRTPPSKTKELFKSPASSTRSKLNRKRMASVSPNSNVTSTNTKKVNRSNSKKTYIYKHHLMLVLKQIRKK